MDFYAYRMMSRDGSFNSLPRFKKLFSQYLVDIYAKVEQERLSYLFTHQGQLRAASYVALRDHVQGGDAANPSNAADIGQRIVLPSSFVGGPRYMHERTQDAMTYVRRFGRPDKFITFTCNPMWLEITR
ncbi:hypothetical protein ACOMHN_065111 [Nucella lapillus]